MEFVGLKGSVIKEEEIILDDTSVYGGSIIDVPESESQTLSTGHLINGMASSCNTVKVRVAGRAPRVEDCGMLGLLNPEMVILDVKDESYVKEEPDVKDELPSSDDQHDTGLAVHFDCQGLVKEEEILVKSETCNCIESCSFVESCNCAMGEPSPDSDGETLDVENIQPLLNTQNQAVVPESDRLKKKITFHKGLKYYHCDACNYKCLQLAHMEYHLRKHTGEKPLACGYCDYRASHPTTLKRHVRSLHTGEKPYSCKLCDYKAAQPGALARHMRTHTGEKPYACEWCSFRTADLSTINVHKSTHTGEKPFKCQLCGYATSRKRGLRRHLIREHPEAPPLPFRMIQPLKTAGTIQIARIVGRSKNSARFRNFKGEWSPGEESMSSGSESDVEPDCTVDIDSDTNVNVEDWALPDASSSGRRIRAPKRLDL